MWTGWTSASTAAAYWCQASSAYWLPQLSYGSSLRTLDGAYETAPTRRPAHNATGGVTFSLSRETALNALHSPYMDRTVILYHGSCPDGFGSAYAAWKRFGETAEYIPLHRGDPLPEGLEGDHLYFLDFTYEQADMDHFVAIAKTVTVLDHHSGVQDVVESMPAYIYDNNKSGAGISWSYFNPTLPFPKLLEHIQDDDLFRFALPDTKAVLSYLTVHPFTFESWDELAQKLEDEASAESFLTTAHAYAQYTTLLAQSAANKAVRISFEGYEVMFANAHPSKVMKSLVGNLLAKEHPPFALVASAHPKGFGISIRGNGSVNVAKLAEKYGGNGHHDSAGFLVPAEQPMPWTLIEDEDSSN